MIHRLAVAGILVGFIYGSAMADSRSDRQFLTDFGRKGVEALKQPEFAVSRCMLPPVLSSDGMTVAKSTDHAFTAGDVIISAGGRRVDGFAKHPVRDALSNQKPSDSIVIELLRGGEKVEITATCADSKLYNDLVLEAVYAASNGDGAGCADKMNAAREVHEWSAGSAYIWFQCSRVAGRLEGTELSRSFYEVKRLAIQEREWSSAALEQIRGEILSSIELLRQNDGGVFADYLTLVYDDALAHSKQYNISTLAKND